MPAKTALASEAFFVTGGTLPLDAGSYVTRLADTELFESLSAGEYCYVLNTRQMGKSSLMVRTAVKLRDAGASVAVLDLTAIGQNVTPEQWYDGLLIRLGRQLDLEDELEEFFHRNTRLGPLQRFMEAIARVALKNLQGQPGNAASMEASPRPLVIFIDEIDAVRSLPFPVDEFFAGIRECYNRRTEEPLYRGLTFCLLGVATPSDLVADTRTSPFNIGRRIVLADFTEAEAAPLADGFNRLTMAANGQTAAESRKLLARVLYWTSGHPYMTQRLCRAVADAWSHTGSETASVREYAAAESGSENQTPNGHPESKIQNPGAQRPPRIPSVALVDSMAASLFMSQNARESDENLAFVRNRLLRSDGDVAALLDLYRKVRDGKRVRDDETSPQIALLRLAGIVKVVNGILEVRNRIYLHVFDQRWIRANMPGAEIERQRAAFRAGTIRAAAIGGLIAIAMAGLAITSLVYKHRADVSAKAARDEADNSKISTAKALASEQREKLSEQRAKDLAATAQDEQKRAIEFGQTLVQTFEKLTHEQNVAQSNLRKAKASAIRAGRAENLQRQETKRLNRVLYDSTMNLVQREYEAHEYERMQELLNQTSHAEDKGFEWRFWQGLCPLQHSTNAHAGEVFCAAVSPDGKRIATGGADKSVVVTDAATGDVLTRWKEDSDVRGVAFTQDSKKLAIGLSGTNKPGRATIRAVDSGKVLVTLPLTTPVRSLAFSHSGKQLATNGERVQIWDSETGEQQEDYGPGGPAIAFAPDDTRICFSRWSESGKPAEVDVLDLGEGAVSFSLNAQAQTGQVRAIAWSPDDTRIATGSDDRVVRVWDAHTGALSRTLPGHGDAVISACFSPDSKRLVSSGLDDEARVWDLDTPADATRPLPPPQGGARLRPQIRDFRLFARENRVLFKHSRQAIFSPDGSHIVTGSFSGIVRTWNAMPAASYLVLEGPPLVSLDHVGAVAFAPDNRQIVASIDSTIATIWDAHSGTRKRDLRGHAGDISALAFFPDSGRIASAGWDGSVKVWEPGFGRRTLTLQGHKGNVNCVAVAQNGRILVSGGDDRTAIIWDAKTGRRLFTLALATSVAQGVAISPDGSKVAIAQTDNDTAGRITLWDVNTGKFIRTIASLPHRIFAVRFSPDGAAILAGVDDRTARIWEVATGKLLLTLAGHTSGVNSVAFSFDGRRVVTGSFDTTAKLWDAHTGKEILTLHHPTFVVGVGLSRDGKRIVTACEDGSTRVWTAD